MQLPFDSPSCPSVGWSVGCLVGWYVCHNLLIRGQENTLPCSYRSTLLYNLFIKAKLSCVTVPSPSDISLAAKVLQYIQCSKIQFKFVCVFFFLKIFSFNFFALLQYSTCNFTLYPTFLVYLLGCLSGNPLL